MLGRESGKEEASRGVFYAIFWRAMLFKLSLVITFAGYGGWVAAAEPYHGGVYLYAYNCGDYTTISRHLTMLARLGLDRIHITSQSTRAVGGFNDDDIVAMGSSNGQKITFQLDQAYYNNNNSTATMDAKAKIAANFINKWASNPSVLSFSIREEPARSEIPGLLAQYNRIMTTYGTGTNTPFDLLFLSNPQTTIADVYNASYHPPVTGTDPYFLQWYMSSGGFLYTPLNALDTYNSYLKAVRAYMHDDQITVAVMAGAGIQLSHPKTWWQTTFSATEYTRLLSLAQAHNQGLNESGTDINYAFFYHGPEGVTRAMTWLAVARGYRGTYVWYADPAGLSTAKHGMIRPDGTAHPSLIEYGEAVKDLGKFGWLINRMIYTQNDAYVSYTDVPGHSIYAGGFTLPGYTGKILVVVNADVGAYCGGRPAFCAPGDLFRVNDSGDVSALDYTPKTTNRIITIQNTAGGIMYNLETGLMIGNGTSGDISVYPGKGAFVFIGPLAELNDIRARNAAAPRPPENLRIGP